MSNVFSFLALEESPTKSLTIKKEHVITWNEAEIQQHSVESFDRTSNGVSAYSESEQLVESSCACSVKKTLELREEVA